MTAYHKMDEQVKRALHAILYKFSREPYYLPTGDGSPTTFKSITLIVCDEDVKKIREFLEQENNDS